MKTASQLDHILVVTFAKGFWATPDCQIFPQILYGRRYVKKMSSLLNMALLALQTYWRIWQDRPTILFIGAAYGLAPWFLSLKKYHLLPARLKIICHNYSIFHDARVRYADLVIDHDSSTLTLRSPETRRKSVVIPLPAPGNLVAARTSALPAALQSVQSPYIFSGGGEGRDFPTLIEAARSLPISLMIITFSRRTLNYDQPLPDNCHVFWTMSQTDFLAAMHHALFVIVPLTAGVHPHGQTTVVQALALGKAVITSDQASVNDYVQHDQQGLLVPAGDVAALRAAIQELNTNPGRREQYERVAREQAERYTYAAFGQQLTNACRNVITQPEP